MKYPSRRQYKHAKKRYRVRNWASYERALRQRADLTVWFSQDAVEAWREPAQGRTGGQRIYASVEQLVGGLQLASPMDELKASEATQVRPERAAACAQASGSGCFRAAE